MSTLQFAKESKEWLDPWVAQIWRNAASTGIRQDCCVTNNICKIVSKNGLNKNRLNDL